MTTKIKVAGRALEILQIEDNLGDVTILREVLKGAGFPARLNRVSDGEEAMAFLARRGIHFLAPRPDVILLDLKLPKKDGLTVLNEIKQSPVCRSLPVIVLTNSESDLDMSWAKRFDASDYIVKPMRLEEFGTLVKHLREYWVKTFRSRPVVEPGRG